MPEGIYAHITTNRGDLLARLEYERVPLTVANFVALVEGKMENTIKPLGEPYYDGMTFHRVIPDFMVQGGDPNTLPGGDSSLVGLGNPGYRFQDEFNPQLKHNTAGTLSMANSGRHTNGSQFFITHKATPWLDNVHSVFGYVNRNLRTLYKIQPNDTIVSIRILRVGAKAEAFDAVAVFEEKADKLPPLTPPTP
ncbi:MAG: peptidylprolyl isomerase [Bacteroidetes bacterium]|nr:MAG: peptidylprolyl isomerase [Bacteroidota bacterium]